MRMLGNEFKFVLFSLGQVYLVSLFSFWSNLLLWFGWFGTTYVIELTRL